MEILSSFIPMDRRQAMALGRGGALPDRAEGAALREILKTGCSHLQIILAGFDIQKRRMFLENVPPNREFSAACQKEGYL